MQPSTVSSVTKPSRKTEKINKDPEKDVVGFHTAFFGYFLEIEIPGFLPQIGDWFLCFLDGSQASVVCAIALRVSEKDVTYFRLIRKRNNEFGATRILKHENGRLLLSAHTPQTHEDENMKSVVDLPLSLRSLKKLIAAFKEKGIPGVKTPMKRLVKRPNWILPYRSSRYNVTNVVGVGNFGRVVRGIILLPNRPAARIAVKMVMEGATEEERLETRKKVAREATIHVYCNHENVVKCYGLCADFSQLSIVMELCSGGSLDDYIRTHFAQISPNEFPFYIADISNGLRFVHQKGYIHRDIALRNCLISSCGLVKISDFGLACSVEELARHDKDTNLHNAPIRWMAPETLRKRPIFSPASDVWALGMTIYEIYNRGERPWPLSLTAKQIKNAICDGQIPIFPEIMPVSVRAVLRRCWDKDSARRASIESIITEVRNTRGDPSWTHVTPGQLSIHYLPGVRNVRRDISKMTCMPSTTVSKQAL